jgi:hypothetical protein
MVRYYLDTYCTILNKDIYEEYSPYGLLVDLRFYLPKLKSEILTNCLEFEIDKKIEYLNLVSNEVSNLTVADWKNISVINKWLSMFEISFMTIINSNLNKEAINVYLEADYAKFEEEEDDIIKRKQIFDFQLDFFNVFKNYFIADVVNFCNSTKSDFAKKKEVKTTINKPFKDEYLNAFKKAITDERQIKETCFDLVYESIIHYVPYLENEVMENLLLLNTDKKDDYLNFAIDTLKKTEFSDCDENIISKWLTKYNAPISEFPTFSNEDLKHWLNRYYNGYADVPKDYDFILDIQIDFYCYAAGLEAQKMILFLESKKSAAVKKEEQYSEQHTESKEKIKWIGKPSQLGFIIGKLVELGYIDAPKRINGETNFTQFAKQVKNTFDVDTTESTLSKYLNLESEKGQETNRKFNENGFDIPHIKEIS